MPPTTHDHQDNNRGDASGDGDCCRPRSTRCRCRPGSWCWGHAGDRGHPDDDSVSIRIFHPIRVRRFRPQPDRPVEASVEHIGVFLPNNYTAAEDPTGDLVVVAGWDYLGWTLDTYVLGRLASGLIFPIQPGEPQRHLEWVLNSFDEGYQAASETIDPADRHLVDVAEGRRDCIEFVLANYHTLASVDLDRSYRHGEDFYLTRNRHGAGFWDRGYGPIGRTLTQAAHAYGPTP